MTAGAAARGNQAARWPDATLPHRVPVPRALRSGTLPAQIDYSVRHSQTRVAAPSASITADTRADADRALITQCHLGSWPEGARIADSALKDGQMELSPTAAHISHSGGQPTAPQVSTRSGEHHTVR
jgi:hypothetical protein